jgi:uncharacterized protein YqjF (DUF2071 family)
MLTISPRLSARHAPSPPVFLTAEWRTLLLLNYDVDPRILMPFVPAGTELDLWQDRAIVSLVGFRFLRTRLRGWAIPFHQDFDEVNLRFYVRRMTAEGWRRGVVFIREIVPKFAVAWVANTVYHERYVRRAMRHELDLPRKSDATGSVCYAVQDAGHWLTLSAEIASEPMPLVRDSEAEFLLEHYWGYTQQPDGSTHEYHVEHPPWRVWEVTDARLTGDCGGLYGAEFAAVLNHKAQSALVAEGSAVRVREGRRLSLDLLSPRDPIGPRLSSA